MQVLANAVRKGKEIKGTQMRKEEIKLFLFTDDMNAYVENPKQSTENLLELLCQDSKVSGCKVNIQKSVAFLYTSSKQ